MLEGDLCQHCSDDKTAGTDLLSSIRGFFLVAADMFCLKVFPVADTNTKDETKLHHA